LLQVLVDAALAKLLKSSQYGHESVKMCSVISGIVYVIRNTSAGPTATEK
jgi:hypothetical protein